MTRVGEEACQDVTQGFSVHTLRLTGQHMHATCGARLPSAVMYRGSPGAPVELSAASPVVCMEQTKRLSAPWRTSCLQVNVVHCEIVDRHFFVA